MKCPSSIFSFKTLRGFVRPGRAVWLAVGLIIVFVVCWYTALTRIPLSIMMAWSAVVLPLIAVGAWIWLGEPLGAGKLASIGVISVGVAMLSVF